MNFKTFLWDKTLALVFNITGIIIISVYVGIISGAMQAITVALGWLVCLILYLAVSFFILKKRIEKIRKTVAMIQDKFLLSEVIPSPLKSEDSLYYELMLLQGKAAIEKVTDAENEKSEYYDYIQKWVHEMKTPIAAITLICSSKGDELREILRQLNKITNYTEQILYEAKSNSAEKDMFIKKTETAKVVNDCIKENKQLFIDSHIAITVEAVGFIYTDEKWLGFILKQILINCAQYKNDENAQIKISVKALSDDEIELSVWDNGIGILKSELPRIFDKGFTGSNGRRNKKSTGLGLYLCKKLCDALNISISADSNAGQYSCISLKIAAAKT